MSGRDLISMFFSHCMVCICVEVEALAVDESLHPRFCEPRRRALEASLAPSRAST